MKAVVGLAGTTYTVRAATKMADNDFDNVGFKTILKKSIEAVQWVMRIGKHIGTINTKKFETVKFRNDNTEIGIPNKKGELLWIPKFYLDLYAKCPQNILEKLVGLVEEERSLYVGVEISGNTVFENLTTKHKQIFLPEKEPELLFPELIHGMEVVLQGEITRGNETTNTMGFRYNEHILTAYPESGSVVNYKESLFLEAEITGKINRKDENGEIKLKRPKIIFTKKKSIPNKKGNLPLFN
ncbi:MAG: hypothetical protein ACI8PB_004158 [Desulforhopalus sp.]